MRKLTHALLALPLLIASGAAVAQQAKEHNEMLYPSVLVDAGGSTGSGTVLWSAKPPESWCKDGCKLSTLVLTNHHVIAGSVDVSSVWDPKEKKEVKKETRSPVTVNWFQYNDFSRAIGFKGQTADIVAYDADLDLALLLTRDHEQPASHVAHIQGADDPLYLFEQTFAVGAGLGKPPFPTEGILANLDQRLGTNRFILSSAPIIFGNSGGGLYHLDVKDDRYELIGVPARVSGSWAGIVTHMAWSIPRDQIAKFLEDNDFGYVVGMEPKTDEKADDKE